jgi:hypothetical protein
MVRQRENDIWSSVDIVKWRKYSPVKFANFVYICITHGKNNTLHNHFTTIFATKLCNFTHFKMLFPAMPMVLNGFRSSCLDQNFVYSWNHPLLILNVCVFLARTVRETVESCDILTVNNSLLRKLYVKLIQVSVV